MPYEFPCDVRIITFAWIQLKVWALHCSGTGVSGVRTFNSSGSCWERKRFKRKQARLQLLSRGSHSRLAPRCG
ncbi:hypothetical protein WJX73_006890 [Symbiochloris irregularis]|uniref:Uncharacterized protein n=1 Tax=Symbiochloris irregularis TaxID=706552 RepID=A0AAW1P093_9CHLO